MPIPQTLDYNIRRLPRGDTRAIDFTAYKTDASLVDLTGYSLRLVAKWTPTDSDGAALITKTLGSGITCAFPTSGVLTVTFNPGDTSSLPGHRLLLYYDLQITLASAVWTIYTGRLDILPDVSQTTP